MIYDVKYLEKAEKNLAFFSKEKQERASFLCREQEKQRTLFGSFLISTILTILLRNVSNTDLVVGVLMTLETFQCSNIFYELACLGHNFLAHSLLVC